MSEARNAPEAVVELAAAIQTHIAKLTAGKPNAKAIVSTALVEVVSAYILHAAPTTKHRHEMLDLMGRLIRIRIDTDDIRH